MHIHRLLAVAGAVAALAVAGAPEARTLTATVTFDDFDLSDPADFARLKGRIDRAVRALCGSRVAFSVTGNAAEATAQCRESARRSANREVARVLGSEQRRVAAATFATGSTD